MNDAPSNLARRNFFRQLFYKTAGYTSEIYEEFNNKPQMQLGELTKFSDSVFRQVIPVFHNDAIYQLHVNSFKIKNAATGEFIEILQLENKDCDILELFSQDLTLEQIANQFAAPGSTHYEQIYRRVKTLFLTLVKYAVCHPQQSLADIQVE